MIPRRPRVAAPPLSVTARRSAPGRPAVAALAAALLLLAACNGQGAPSASPPATPPPARTVDLAGEAADLTVWAAESGDLESDLPALASGDVNADGTDDLIVGARFGDGPDNTRTDAGEAYVIFGSSQLPATVDVAAGEQDVTLWGAAASGNLGFSLLSADVNDDGVDDILAGAPFASRPDAPASQIGAVFVFFGSPDLQDGLDAAAGEQDLTLWGPSPTSFFGDSLAAGDVNGDGIRDIIVGATFSPGPDGGDREGAVYVVFGSPDLAGERDMAAGAYDFALSGAGDLDEVGDAVASGDVNGDGLDDLLVVGEAADGPANERSTGGEAYVVFGSPDLGGVATIGEDAPDVTIFGAETNDIFGFSVAGADIDGDGIDDVLVGARGGDGPEGAPRDAGAVYAVLGSHDLPAAIDTARGEEEFSIHGGDDGDLLDVVTAADVDGDGRAELVASAAYGDGPGNSRREAGEAFLIIRRQLAGAVAAVDASPLLTVYGPAEEGRLGAAALAADLNDDGRGDLVALSPDGDGPGGSRPDAGQVYVIFGR